MGTVLSSDEYQCICGGMVPVPHQMFRPPSTAMQAICSDVCGRVWEFAYFDSGEFTGQAPELVPPVPSSVSIRGRAELQAG